MFLCLVQLLAWKPFYAAAVVGPAAWPRCSVDACRPMSGIPAAGSMLLGSGKPGPGVPTQYGSSLQLSGSPPKSGPVGRDGSYTYNLALPMLPLSGTDGDSRVSALREHQLNLTHRQKPSSRGWNTCQRKGETLWTDDTALSYALKSGGLSNFLGHSADGRDGKGSSLPLGSWWLPAHRPHPPRLHQTAHWIYRGHHGAASHSQPPWPLLQKPGR